MPWLVWRSHLTGLLWCNQCKPVYCHVPVSVHTGLSVFLFSDTCAVRTEVFLGTVAVRALRVDGGAELNMLMQDSYSSVIP
jgi:hypothetical protein